MPLAFFTIIFLESAYSTTPSALQTIVDPESRAAIYSTPVPTIGASVLSSGTAWRCMFEPINARLASSWSKNGIQLVVTETIWLGETSTKLTLSASTITFSPFKRAITCPSVILLSLSTATVAWLI